MVRQGDCREILFQMLMDGERFEAVVTDPPYDLTSTVERFGKPDSAPIKDPTFARMSKGFMGKTWDGSGVAFDPATWEAVYSVMKPGAHLLAFGGSRTYHRMACAIEDAGFELRDCIMYLYGTGFPKSHNVNKALGDAVCTCGSASTEHGLRSVRGADLSSPVDTTDQCREVLQPSMPEQGASAVSDDTQPRDSAATLDRISQSGLEGRCDVSETHGQLRSGSVRQMPAGTISDGSRGRLCDGAPVGNGALGPPAADSDRVRASQGSQPAAQRSRKSRIVAGQSQPQTGGAWPICDRCGKPRVASGLGTALKPAFEPIIVARKPIDQPTVAANVLTHGTGAINIDACRVPAAGRPLIESKSEKSAGVFGDGLNGSRAAGTTDAGRHPANVIHDGSDEVEAAFARFGERPGAVSNGSNGRKGAKGVFECGLGAMPQVPGRGDTGTASRFYYSAKAGKADRAGSSHPTVKPLALMRYLCKLVTPPGGTILDPFAGSGTTLQAALECGFKVVGIEREAEYIADIEQRLFNYFVA